MCISVFAFIVGRRSVVAISWALVGAVATNASAQAAFEDVSVAAGFGAAATETWGASWGDLNGDHYPDLFINNHRQRAKLYLNNRDGTFSDVSKKVDVSKTPGWVGGRANVDTHAATWADLDNDGDQDLYESVSSSDDRLHINDAGSLPDRTTIYEVDQLDHAATRQNVFLDFNGDGLLDVGSLSLRRPAFSPQLPDGKFGHGLEHEVPMACTSDAQWAHLVDIDATPGLELVCATRNGTYPKVNAFDDGEVVDVTANFPQYARIADSISLDYDRDLRPDLLLVRGGERSSDAYQPLPEHFEVQFITAGNKAKSVKFKSEGVLTVSASLRAGSDPQGNPDYIDIGLTSWSPTTLAFELNKDNPINVGIGSGSPGFNMGYLAATGEWQIVQGTSAYNYSYVQVTSTAPITDLTFTGASASDKGSKPLLIRNTPTGFVNIANPGFSATLRCQSAVAGDFDNDMDEDVFFACTGGAHNLPDRLYLNNGAGKFTEAPNAGGAAGIVGSAVSEGAGTSDSVVTADYDLDGFLDLLVVNGLNMRPIYIGGPKQLFHNLGNANHWMEFDLVGTTSNRDGIGARVYATTAGITQYREQNGGYHRWSQNFMRVHFGLASNTAADIRVEWPDGTSTVYPDLESNHVYQLRQDGDFVQLGD